MGTKGASASGIWFIRVGGEARWIQEFLDEGVVAIGWLEVGEVSSGIEKHDLVHQLETVYPGERPGWHMTSASQIKRFLQDVQVGDAVMTYAPGARQYYLGTITSPPRFRPAPMCRLRDVSWAKRVNRDALTAAARNTLGAILTLFKVNPDVSREIEARAVAMDAPAGDAPPPSPPAEDEGEEALALAAVPSRASELIEDMIVKLSWEQMQEFVAGLLRAMGYRTTISPQGSDRGVDVFASRDGLGLEEPRIFVEVKHRPGLAMGAPELRSFLGGRKAGDRCLYVSTGGFTKDARYEAERAPVPLQLLEVPDLRRLLQEHHDALDQRMRTLVPLQRLYWPL